MREDLQTIYDTITRLRLQGTKMKDIATRLSMSPSVLSAIYTTVLPAFLARPADADTNNALDEALALVNNVSRKRLLAAIPNMLLRLQTFSSPTPAASIPIEQALAKAWHASANEAAPYAGVYQSYSLSSSTDALKVEPYLIVPAPDASSLRVARLSAYRTIQWGTGIINNHQNLYLTFSETVPPQLNLVTLYLQLPFREQPGMLRGLYLALDYNRNPIARRIVLVRQSDPVPAEEFATLPSGIIAREQLTPEQETYYQYTCLPGDYIKMCTVPTPRLDATDLAREKKMLEL